VNLGGGVNTTTVNKFVIYCKIFTFHVTTIQLPSSNTGDSALQITSPSWSWWWSSSSWSIKRRVPAVHSDVTRYENGCGSGASHTHTHTHTHTHSHKHTHTHTHTHTNTHTHTHTHKLNVLRNTWSWVIRFTPPATLPTDQEARWTLEAD